MSKRLPIVNGLKSQMHELPQSVELSRDAVDTEPTMLPTVRALDSLWQQVSRRPLWAPPNFWRYVSLRRRMRLTLLDPRRVRIAAPPGKINDCGCCNDICCVGPRSAVLLRLRDIATLVDVGRTDLIATQKPAFSTEQLAKRPALARHVGSAAWATFPVLRQGTLHACAALTAAGKCALFPYWPLSCARFPYSLRLEHSEAFFSQRCNSYWIHPSLDPVARRMAEQAVAGYNERIKDFVLLSYARDALRTLGLLKYLQL